MTLAYFWAGALALATLLYVVLDGFDLGVGILFGFTREEAARRDMLATISPVWDGNETWIVVAVAVLFAAFPVVYALVLSAFYFPLCVMLAALILRGVAFEYREKAGVPMRQVWDAGLAVGSFVAAFMQGAMVGALVQGLPVGPGGVYAGKGALDSLTPFAALCGLGLCLGDVLLGAAWLVMKSEGKLRERCYRVLPALLAGVLAFLGAAFVASIGIDLRMMHRWIDRPWLVVFPLIGVAAVFAMRHGIRRRLDAWPFASAAAIFLAAFATLAASFLPYMVPYSITIAEAAAPRSSLAFIFWGAGAFVLPLMLVYTITAYSVFRGKARHDGEYH